ncbi:MAG TPA: IS256 family transposase [Candidatus Wujingus californicus]|uniref:IS256 family transposase n=1 Tax=Candidatus Wujingus californicus TaxID=3367618 RepID=UPI0040260972
MTQTLLQSKTNNILFQGLKNLRLSLDSLTLETFVVNSLEMLMLLEREEYLQNLKTSGVQDKGNGHYPRSFKSLSRNSIIINIPRTRYTDFKPFVLEFLKYNQEQINDLVLTLYRKGLTTRDVSDILKSFFGEDISYAQVSNLAERFNELRVAWENSSLASYYKVVFCDAIYITVKRDNSYAQEPVHIMYGVREDNKRELLGLGINPTESASSWSEIIANLRTRGVEHVDLFVADGLPVLENEIHKYFPGAEFQKCVVHKMRNILNKTRPKHKAEVATDLKEVFNNFDKNDTIKDAQTKLNRFVEKWKAAYPEFARFFEKDTTEYYFSYVKFPCNLRRMIYSQLN